MQKHCTDPVQIADNIAAFETPTKNAREQVVCEKDDPAAANCSRQRGVSLT
jgi:hypothetical protein